MLCFTNPFSEDLIVKRERIADNVFSFQSEYYAQVTAGAVIGPDWAVVIDTLAYPEETLEIRGFIEGELNKKVNYVINTHYHADHSWGSCFFPDALVIAHSKCRKLIEEKGFNSLEETKKQSGTFKNTRLVLPHITFESGEFHLNIGKKTLSMFDLPGHSLDGIGVFIEEDRVLFSGDIFMPIPYIVDGDYELMVASYKKVKEMSLENIVQGHGDVVLRGEIELAIDHHLKYLATIRKIVRRAARRKYPGDMLETVDVESCGKSRVILGGLAEELHQRNLKALYEQLYGEPPAYSIKDDSDLYY
jgi:glyoxylase-like metal-dependent hydrolase (beta-lactamase superfamily II)